MFSCPSCQGTKLLEHEVIIREVRGINTQNLQTDCNQCDRKIWWSCARCGYCLSVASVEQLVQYLENFEEKNDRIYPG